MSALKDIYSPSFYDAFANTAELVIRDFDRKLFVKMIFDNEWKNRELMQRTRHTSMVLHQFLYTDFDDAAIQIEQLSIKLAQSNTKENLFGFMFLPGYIELYGLNHLRTSIHAIEVVTQFVSCEYAVRPFILKYQDEMILQLLKWSKHENHHVRRLASEACRPRLPWAMGIPELKKDPRAILPILDNLKQDGSEYVRRSVANNLNDIAKDHADIVITIANKWKGVSKDTDALIRHGCRTLLKQGNKEVLKFFGLHNKSEFGIFAFKIKKSKIKIGEDLTFSFFVKNGSNRKQLIRLEYAIYYLRQNGHHSKKVFKINERIYMPDEEVEITKKQSFKVITTKKFYAGQHRLAIILNGHEKTDLFFQLV